MLTELDRAIKIAVDAHAGQVDKSGIPYIYHPLRVMLAVSPDAKVAAVLHDVIEDTDWTYERLQDNSISPENRLVVNLLTRMSAEDDPDRLTYRQYLKTIKEYPGKEGKIAREIKLADVKDNMSRPMPDELKGMIKGRYQETIDYLLEV